MHIHADYPSAFERRSVVLGLVKCWYVPRIRSDGRCVFVHRPVRECLQTVKPQAFCRLFNAGKTFNGNLPGELQCSMFQAPGLKLPYYSLIFPVSTFVFRMDCDVFLTLDWPLRCNRSSVEILSYDMNLFHYRTNDAHGGQPQAY